MKTVVGIFSFPSAADRAVKDLVSAGVPPARIRQLTPGSPEREIHSAIPTAETEQPGMGKAVGAVVGFAVGLTAVLSVGVLLYGERKTSAGRPGSWRPSAGFSEP